MSDGRLARGPLYDLLKERLQVAGDLDAVGLVIETWGGNRTNIAALATTVEQAVRAVRVSSRPAWERLASRSR